MLSSYQNGTDKTITLHEIVSSISEFIKSDFNASYTLTIGTDSETKGTEGILIHELITAIVIHRKGFGGRYFWKKNKKPTVKTLREKIYREVFLSLDTAQEILPILKKKLNGASSKYKLEIHIDVGETGETKEMLTEVVGIVSGSGFVARTKPYSYAASNVADRHM